LEGAVVAVAAVVVVISTSPQIVKFLQTIDALIKSNKHVGQVNIYTAFFNKIEFKNCSVFEHFRRK